MAGSTDPNAIQPGESYQHWAARTGQDQGGTSKGVYIGVEAGSDLEKNGIEGAGYGLPGSAAAARYSPISAQRGYYGRRKPLYKVGYQNSKQFRRELNNMDPNVIEMYQVRLYNAGLLKSFTPKVLDKATRAAFKDLLGTANQNGADWQSTLQNIEDTGGMVGSSGQAQQPDAFVAQLDDPVTLRATFQRAAQDIYGGNLPDSEVDGMVEAYRAQQLFKQKAAYDASLAANDGGVSGTVDQEIDPSAYVTERIKAAHPDQVAKVEFSGTLNNALSSLSKTGGGLM